MNIKVFLTQNGTPKTGLTPTYASGSNDIENICNNNGECHGETR